MARMSVVVFLVLLMAAFAGCLGEGDDLDPGGNQPDGSGEGSEDEQKDDEGAEDPVEVEWVWDVDVIDGWITGSAPGVGGFIINGENFHFEFEVLEGTSVLFLNLSTEGAELAIGINDPDCDPQTATICEAVGTRDGEVSHRIDDPLVGDWEVYVGPDDPVVLDQAFELVVARGAEAPA